MRPSGSGSTLRLLTGLVFTIVALAIRQADHIASELGKGNI